MSGRPILDDTDFNFTEIMKGRLENVSSLPTGLGSDEKGYSVYYAEKIWVWDGINWNTWDSMPWTYEDSDVLDPNNPRLEETVVHATSSFLHTKSWNIAMSEGYSDNSANTVGTLHFIGAADIISNWDEIKGRRFVYTAKNGSWFNIKDNSSELVPDNHKKINTRTETDILDVVKAEFSYDNFRSRWILISFERKQEETGITQSSLNQELKGINCCKQVLLYELLTTGIEEKLILGDVPEGLQIYSDSCSYFKVRIEGEWSAHQDDNDEGYDFFTKPVFCQFLTRNSETSAWNFERSKQYNWQSGDTIYFDEEFIFMTEEDLFVGCSLSETDNDHGVTVIPIQNWERFWIRMTITKCPKRAWFKRFDIPGTPLDTVSMIFDNVPKSLEEGLPLDGFYHVDLFIQTAEYKDDMVTRKFTENPQTLEIYTPGDNWRIIDMSGHFAQGYEPAPSCEWFNNSLQGSAIVYVQWNLCGQRDFTWRVTLPNGIYKQILGGYLHARYIGGIEGILCKQDI